MTRRAARCTQSDIARALRAVEGSATPKAVEIPPDGIRELARARSMTAIMLARYDDELMIKARTFLAKEARLIPVPEAT